MRPLHALLLIAALAVALLTGLFLIGTDDRTGAVAPPIAQGSAQGGTSTNAPTDASLEAPDGRSPADSRAAKTNAGLASSSDAATKWQKSEVPGFALQGRIVTPAGNPVINATVYAAAAQGLSEIALDEMDPQEMPWLHRVDTKTDERGRFALRPQAQGSLRFAVRAAGFAPHDADVAIAGTGQDMGDVVLEPGVVLSGRVIDSAGRGVSGAELHHKRDTGGGIVVLGGTRGALLAKTDEQGHFKIDQLASGSWKIAVTSEDHPDKIESGETERPGSSVSNLEFALEDGAEIQGRVVGAPPQSLASLWVRAAARPAGPGDDAQGGSFASEVNAGPFGYARRARCGTDGGFLLRGLKKGQNYRLIGREGEGEFGGRTRTQALQAKAGDRGVELKWKPETALVFQVVDAVSSAPLTDFTVEAGFGWSLPLTGDDGRPVKHFKDGRVRFANLPQKPEGQTAELSIEAAGFKRYERKSLEPVEGQDLDLGVIRLERAPLVKVLVLDDSSGDPIANASVSLTAEEPKDNTHRMIISMGGGDDDTGGPGRAQRGKTDAEGRVSVTSLPGKQAVLRVRHGGHATFTSEPIALPVSDDLEQTVRLKVGGTVVVEVVDAKGRPVAGQSIQHQGPDGNDPPLLIGGDASDETDALGKLVFEHLEAGRHRFRMRDRADDMMALGGGAVMRTVRRNGDAAESGPKWNDVEVGEKTHEELRLIAPARSSLAGRVTEGGKALSGATVRLSDPSDDSPEMSIFGEGKDARTNGKGEYLLENVKEGEHRVIVSHASRAMSFETSVKLREGENQLDVEMPVCTIEGRVANAEGKPLPGVRVRAERAANDDGKPKKMMARTLVMATSDGDDANISFTTGSGGGEAATTDADGKYRLRGVLSDVDLVVKATGKDVQPGQSAVVHLTPDQTKSGIDLVLLQGGSIEVTVQHADGRAGASCLVRGRIEGDSVDPKTDLSGPSGVVKLTGLKPGKWRLNVNPIGPASVPGPDKSDIPEQMIEVKAGESSKARFEIP